jgi:SAM-dependent methyltransferase
MSVKNIMKSMSRALKKSTATEKVFFVLAIVVIAIIFVNHGRPHREGFEQTKDFTIKKGPMIYDDFYANIYDDLIFNQIKNDYEVGEIVNKTTPDTESLILDIGSGTGHHVKSLVDRGLKAQGIDISPAMVKQAKSLYPELDYRVADALDTMTFPAGSFTHITCLYFTIYYIEDKRRFFENCMQWLMPGGYLTVHLVDRDNFDPIIPAGDPFGVVSPQSYADKRITSTVVKFNNFDYKSNFELRPDDIAIMNETFKYKNNGNVRKNEHKLYMPTQTRILSLAKETGFILLSQIDMLRCQYGSQYMYVLQKPN